MTAIGNGKVRVKLLIIYLFLLEIESALMLLCSLSKQHECLTSYDIQDENSIVLLILYPNFYTIKMNKLL